MLKKARLEDGGLDVETALLGPAVFLDVWAVRDFSRDSAQALRRRFATALRVHQGSLLVSSPWFTELDTLKGNARQRAEAFFASLGANWLLISPVVSVVVAREVQDELGAFLSEVSRDAYVMDRFGELLRANIDPHSLTNDEFFDLSRTLVWAAEESEQPEDLGEKEEEEKQDPRAQAQALREVARVRAEAHKNEQRRDRNAHLRLYPVVSFGSGQMQCVHNAIWREVTRLSPGRTWMSNDGFDIAHLIPALTIGGLVTADTTWQAIGRAASNELPPNHVRLYRSGELDALVTDLERWPDVHQPQPTLQ